MEASLIFIVSWWSASQQQTPILILSFVYAFVGVHIGYIVKEQQ